MKQCSKCLGLKHEEEFYRDKNKPQGLDSHCKECKKLQKNGKKEEPVEKRKNTGKFKVFFD